MVSGKPGPRKTSVSLYDTGLPAPQGPRLEAVSIGTHATISMVTPRMHATLMTNSIEDIRRFRKKLRQIEQDMKEAQNGGTAGNDAAAIFGPSAAKRRKAKKAKEGAEKSATKSGAKAPSGSKGTREKTKPKG